MCVASRHVVGGEGIDSVGVSGEGRQGAVCSVGCAVAAGKAVSLCYLHLSVGNGAVLYHTSHIRGCWQDLLM